MKKLSKLLLLILFCYLISPSCEKESDSNNEDLDINPNPKAYILVPDSQGRLVLSGDTVASFGPGDIIYLRGTFKNIWINDLRGSAEQPIIITNYPEIGRASCREKV